MCLFVYKIELEDQSLCDRALKKEADKICKNA